jgi:hypothetical protein
MEATASHSADLAALSLKTKKPSQADELFGKSTLVGNQNWMVSTTLLPDARLSSPASNLVRFARFSTFPVSL